MKYIYTILTILIFPIILIKLLTGKSNAKYRWKEYLGITPETNFKNKPIWIHAVSVGEVMASKAIIINLRKKHPRIPLLITTTTATGAMQVDKIIKEQLEHDDLIAHRYMPLDIPFFINSFIKKTKPHKLLIMETELWPNLLYTANKNSIEVTIVNARLSKRSYQKYKKMTFVKNLIFPYINKVLAQTIEDKKHFISLGLQENFIIVTGSIKYDLEIPLNQIDAGKSLRNKLGTNKLIWLAISTHEGEDEILIKAHKELQKNQENALLIIAPRHPERFSKVEKLLLDNQIKMSTHTNNIKNPIIEMQDISIYLANTIGEIFTFIESSDICFIGGSLLGEKIGGHNILEPAALSKPILIGPSYYNFQTITDKFISEGGVIVCESYKDIALNLNKIFTDKNILNKMSSVNYDNYYKNKGAIEKTLENI